MLLALIVVACCLWAPPARAQEIAFAPDSATSVAVHTPSAHSTSSATSRDSFDLANGRFYPTGEDGGGLLGYAVLDEPNGPPFWTSYQRLGGIEALGLPLSRPFFLPDANSYQLFQHGALQWQAGATAAGVADLLDLLSAAGLDIWLSGHGIPPAAPELAPRTTSHEAVSAATLAARLSWLSDALIRDYYFAATHPTAEGPRAAAFLRYGLPASPPEVAPASVTQRFQRVVLRTAVLPAELPVPHPDSGYNPPLTPHVGPLLGDSGEDGLESAAAQLPAAAAAQPPARVQVTLVPIGEVLRQSSLLTAPTVAPDRLIGGILVARAPRPQLSWRSDRGWGITPTAPAVAPPTIPAAVATVGSAPAGLPGVLPTTPAAPPGAPGTPPVSDSTPLPSQNASSAVVPTLPLSQTTPTTLPLPSALPTTTTRAAAPTATRRAAPPSTPTTTAVPAVGLQAGAAPVVKGVVNQGRSEHVVIANDGTVAQGMTGWTLRSAAGGQSFAFPSGFVLAPGATVNVHSGAGASALNRPPTDLFATGASIWRNGGDTAMLVDPTGRVVSQFSYGTG